MISSGLHGSTIPILDVTLADIEVVTGLLNCFFAGLNLELFFP
jgi:hypothetical protein